MPQNAEKINPPAVAETAPANEQALAVALDYAKAGVKVFPLGGDKIPCISGWKEKGTTDEATLRNWFLHSSFAARATMIGMHAGANDLLALDADKKPGRADGVAALQRLFADIGIDAAKDLPGMPVTLSPSGSRHYFFKQPIGARIGNSTGRLPAEIDVRGDGGLVALPGSINGKGRYVSAPGAPTLVEAFGKGTIPILPAQLLEIIGPKKERPKGAATGDPLLPHDLVVRILQAVPNDQGYFDARDAWLKFGFAIYAASGGAAYGEWLDWCGTWDGGGDAEKDGAFWDSIETVDSDLSHLKVALEHFGLADLRHEVSQAEAAKAFAAVPINENDPVLQAEIQHAIMMRDPVYREIFGDGDDGDDGGGDDGGANARRNAAPVRLVAASTINPERVEWLWAGHLARGKMHLLAGPSTAGKTTVAIMLAAILSTGGTWPDGTRSEAGDVLIWSGEDGIADTIVPRLLAAGADASRVHVIQAVKDGRQERAFDPSRDMAALSSALDAPELRGKVRLLIVDSLASAIAGDAHRNNEVRRGLQPVVDLAERHGVAVIGIVHFSKGTQGRNVMERINGSLAFGALARIVLICAVEEREDGSRRCMFLRGPSNLGPTGGGWAYEIIESAVPGHDGIRNTVAVFGDALTGSAQAILNIAEGVGDEGGGGALAAAEAFLREKLKNGPVAVSEIKAHAGAEGFAWRTIERAKARVDAAAVKVGKQWSWRLVSTAERFAEESPDGPF